MASFAWKGRDPRGDLVEGVTEAANDAAVADQLLAIGVSPVSIALRATAFVPSPANLWEALSAPGVSEEDLLLLSRQLYTLQKAGVPLLRSLAGLQASTDKRAVATVLADLRASLDQGRELATAMARHPKVFSSFYVAMVRVGELTGRLTESFQRLAEHIEFELDVRGRIKQALRYPTTVMIAIFIAMVVINIFVIPTFANVFAQFKTELPLMTRILLGVSAFTVKYWLLLLAAGIGAVWALKAWLATPEGRYTWDKWLLKLPVAGPIVLKGTLARFARSFAMAERSGVPVSTAMTVAARTLDNAFIRQRIEQMRDGIERGESLSRCAAAAGVFTPIVLQMMAVGEETGELDTLLLEIAGMYERETGYEIKGLSASLEPLLLTIIGALVLVLALGVFLPLWSLGGAATGRGG
jgi:MSHA biogenesis protein MshG